MFQKIVRNLLDDALGASVRCSKVVKNSIKSR